MACCKATNGCGISASVDGSTLPVELEVDGATAADDSKTWAALSLDDVSAGTVPAATGGASVGEVVVASAGADPVCTVSATAGAAIACTTAATAGGALTATTTTSGVDTVTVDDDEDAGG